VHQNNQNGSFKWFVNPTPGCNIKFIYRFEKKIAGTTFLVISKNVENQFFLAICRATIPRVFIKYWFIWLQACWNWNTGFSARKKIFVFTSVDLIWTIKTFNIGFLLKKIFRWTINHSLLFINNCELLIHRERCIGQSKFLCLYPPQPNLHVILAYLNSQTTALHNGFPAGLS